jgi:predicted acetyltransferase
MCLSFADVMKQPGIALVPPSHALLGQYRAALETGWSPNNIENVSATQLAAISEDADAFLVSITQQGGLIRLPDGTEKPRLPFKTFWITDGEFCGQISLRWQPGSDDLPAHVLGHVGYAIVPWKRGRGYATAALGLVVVEACGIGLRRLFITTDPENVASRRVIEANGGYFVEEFVAPQYGSRPHLRYAIEVAAENPPDQRETDDP